MHDRQRHVGMDDTAFGDRAQGERVEMAVLCQPGEEIVGKDAPARAVALAAQIVEVLGAEAHVLHPVHQPLQAGVDAVAGLVAAIVGIAPEEVVELDNRFVQTHAVVELGHGQLVLVGEKNALEGCALQNAHAVVLWIEASDWAPGPRGATI